MSQAQFHRTKIFVYKSEAKRFREPHVYRIDKISGCNPTNPITNVSLTFTEITNINYITCERAYRNYASIHERYKNPCNSKFLPGIMAADRAFNTNDILNHKYRVLCCLKYNTHDEIDLFDAEIFCAEYKQLCICT